MMTIRIQSGAVYTGDTALDIVEQMRAADFEPPPTVREYVTRATARASHYFNVTLRFNQGGTEEQLAELFIAAAIENGFAEKVEWS